MVLLKQALSLRRILLLGFMAAFCSGVNSVIDKDAAAPKYNPHIFRLEKKKNAYLFLITSLRRHFYKTLY